MKTTDYKKQIDNKTNDKPSSVAFFVTWRISQTDVNGFLYFSINDGNKVRSIGFNLNQEQVVNIFASYIEERLSKHEIRQVAKALENLA